MPEGDGEQVHEILTRARAICELARLATQYQVAEVMRPDTMEAALLMVEDLLGHALAQLPRGRLQYPQELNRPIQPEDDGL